MLLTEKKDIIAWLDKYEIDNYRLKKDKAYGYVVDVGRDVFLWTKNLKSIAIKFGVVDGNFHCSENQLTSLIGSPDIVRGNFYCTMNSLVSLEYAPRSVEGDFWCDDNALISLKGIPEILTGDFVYRGNPGLKRFEGIMSLEEIKKIVMAEKFAEKLEHDLKNDLKMNSKKIKI